MTKQDKRNLDDVALDGGWGWIVCFSSFVVFFMVDGIALSYGIVLLNLLESFEESKAKLSLPSSLLLGISMCVGPVVSFLLCHFSFRQVILFGSLLGGAGFLLSSFSVNVEMLIITYGFIGGIGTGLVYLSAILVVGIYFKNRRSLATGIAMSGAGLGIFVMAYVTERLLEEYGWRGTILIQSGLYLNCAVCAALVRPLRKRKSFPVEHSLTDHLTNESSGYIADNSEYDFSREKRFSKSEKHGYIPEAMSNKNVELLGDEKRSVLLQDYKSEQNLQQCYFQTLYVSKSESHLYSTNKDQNQVCIPSIFLAPDRGSGYGDCDGLDEHNSESAKSASEKLSNFDTTNNDSGCCKRKEETYIYRHLSLFRDPMFLMLLTVMTFWTAQTPVFVYLPDLVVSRNIPRTQASLMISGLGAANIAGRILAGYLANRPEIHSLFVYACALAVAGVDVVIIMQCTTFASYMTCSIILGLCIAVCVSLRTIVLVDVLGLSKLTQSFGIIVMMQGICIAVGPPIAGKLYDVTLSYAPSYYICASLHVIAGAICAVMMTILKQRKRSLRVPI